MGLREVHAQADEIRRRLASRERPDTGTPAWAEPQNPSAASAPAPQPTPAASANAAWDFDTLAARVASGPPLTQAERQQALPAVAAEVAGTAADRELATAGDMLVELGLVDGYNPWLVSKGVSVCVRDSELVNHRPVPVDRTLCRQPLQGKRLSVREERRTGERSSNARWLVDLKHTDWTGRPGSPPIRCKACESVSAGRVGPQLDYDLYGWIPARHSTSAHERSLVQGEVRLAAMETLSEQLHSGQLDYEELGEAADRRAVEMASDLAAQVWNENPELSLRHALGGQYTKVRRIIYGRRFFGLADADRDLVRLASHPDVIGPLLATRDLRYATAAEKRLLVADALKKAHDRGL